MTDAISHRGPDDWGYVALGNGARAKRVRDLAPDALARAFLGHRRLSIIDLAGTVQPLENEDGSVWTVFNGEIYNYRELRKRLTQKGHVLCEQGDTEVLVHLWEEFGGMGTLSVTARRRKTLGQTSAGACRPCHASLDCVGHEPVAQCDAVVSGAMELTLMKVGKSEVQSRRDCQIHRTA
jgi:glutamine phosphoribosylpyrophosphate amidotransferase